MPRPFPDSPAHPERVCWGCDRYCPSDDLICGNGSVRSPHPVELFGEGWRELLGVKGDPPAHAPVDAPVDAPADPSPTVT